MRRLLVAVLLVVGCGPDAVDPSTLISDDLEATRVELVDAIWPDGYPTATPVIREVEKPYFIETVAVDPVRVEEATVEVFGFTSTAYVLHPKDPEGFAIVHGGHHPADSQNVLSGGLAETIDLLYAEGFSVAVVQMPLFGWNLDNTGTVNGRAAWIPEGPSRHDALFDFLEPEVGAETFRVFLDPTIQLLNHYGPGVMVGLSGGGWTTHLVAAVDERVTLSVGVAGGLPLYARNGSDEEVGDQEQRFPELLPASWLDVFLLGVTNGRQQIQILNEHDPCCFNADRADYAPLIEGLEPGWSFWTDTTHEEHKISAAALEVIRRAVSTP